METNKSSFLPFAVGYGVCAGALFLFSYTQVDLNLTLSRASIWQTIQGSFQHIGFYERPLATILFLLILVGLFVLYGCALSAVRNGKLTKHDIWRIIGIMTGIGVFAYPAFSYDIFNYLFTAKTVLVYGQNPYLVKPIAFTGVDPWLNFLRWTHLVSAYTPFWIALSCIPFILGFGLFLPSLFATKAMLAFFYLVAVWGVGEVAEKYIGKKALLAMAFFALNPLVYIEAVVSPHNDIVMMALALVSLVFAIRKRFSLSYLALALSVAAKFMTLALYPAAWSGWKRWIVLTCMILALTAGFFEKELLPWYFLWIMPFIALFVDRPVLPILAVGSSMGLLLRYAPYIYFGDYSAVMQSWRTWGTVFPFGIGVICAVLSALKTRKSAGR